MDSLTFPIARVTERADDPVNMRHRDYSYPVNSNRVDKILDNGTLARIFTHDAAGNRLSDTGAINNLELYL